MNMDDWLSTTKKWTEADAASEGYSQPYQANWANYMNTPNRAGNFDPNQIYAAPGSTPLPSTNTPASFLQSLNVPFTPMAAPPMLPMQSALQPDMQLGAQGAMPATKGSGKGPMAQQMPMQAASSFAQAGSNRPQNLQALITSLMSSGLLGGL